MTFSAVSGSQDKMKHVMKALSEEVIDVAPHLTCIGLSKTVVRELLHHYKQLGVKRLVVLRSDFP
ncbi:methylenetetrahydrofolate reductase [Coxiella-like endosymbiont of Rhipicephalus sanguineus]|uniref:methylenetetrahydrofolate reductase n=1 Tax=Coxiella-like endosymbiont of Rhipicephalus sanguineus TaxID=1955402 RepID=UPI0027DFA728|nr:methylenetetrahydrofolate reductase [Coxiella-like endosymbiont of Rhipicephalus sanguineus]